MNRFESYYKKVCDGSIEMDAEAERCVDILNIFQIYYRNLYNKDTNESLFHGIDSENISSTNRSLELLAEFVHEYKINSEVDEKMIVMYGEGEEFPNYDNLYSLLIDSKIKKTSPSIYTLFLHVASLDWQNIDWKIMKLK